MNLKKIKNGQDDNRRSSLKSLRENCIFYEPCNDQESSLTESKRLSAGYLSPQPIHIPRAARQQSEKREKTPGSFSRNPYDIGLK